MTGRDVRELREATGHSLEELSAMLKRSKKLAPLMREQNRGISRAALSRLELAEDEEVEPPELVEWLLQLAPKPDKKEEYEKYLARKATASHGGQQAPSLAMPEPPDAPATTSPEPAAEVNPSLAMPSGALPAAGGVPASAAEKPAGAPEPLAQTRTPSPAPPEPIPTRGEQPPSPLLPLPATRESEVEALHAEKALKMEQSVRRTEAALQRAEQLLIEEEGRRQEQSRRMEESVRRAESMAQRAEQLYRELEARRTDDAGHAAQAARAAEEAARQARVAARRRTRQWVAATLAASVVLGMGGGMLVQLMGAKRTQPAMDGMARNEPRDAGTAPDRYGTDREQGTEELPDPEAATSAGLDAGTELAKVLPGALPMLKTGLPGQQAAPCPESAEEINGFCWWRWPLTAAQVKDGACERAGELYEPSAGWCRANRAGYRPVFGARRNNNNVVDP